MNQGRLADLTLIFLPQIFDWNILNWDKVKKDKDFKYFDSELKKVIGRKKLSSWRRERSRLIRAAVKLFVKVKEIADQIYVDNPKGKTILIAKIKNNCRIERFFIGTSEYGKTVTLKDSTNNVKPECEFGFPISPGFFFQLDNAALRQLNSQLTNFIRRKPSSP